MKPFVNDSDPEKMTEFIDALDATDYVVESSNRVYGTVTRVPARWPNMTLYYESLNDGSLGFEKVKEFTNYPQIFGIDIPDQGAEEAFTVYDHPKVTVWKKTDAYSHDLAVQVLRPSCPGLRFPSRRSMPGRTHCSSRRVCWRRRRPAERSRTSSIPATSSTAHPLFFWLLAIELAAFSLVPLAIVGLPRAA